MRVYFGRKADDKIGVNTSRTIGIPLLRVTRTRLSNCNIFYLVIRGLSCLGTIKSESENLVENLRGNNIFKNYNPKTNF